MPSEQQQVVDLSRPIVVDGTNLIAGRLASNVAKLLRKGTVSYTHLTLPPTPYV